MKDIGETLDIQIMNSLPGNIIMLKEDFIYISHSSMYDTEDLITLILYREH